MASGKPLNDAKGNFPDFHPSNVRKTAPKPTIKK